MEEKIADIVKRVEDEADKRKLEYVFPQVGTLCVKESYDKIYAFTKIEINKNNGKSVVFVGLNPRREGNPLSVYKARKEYCLNNNKPLEFESDYDIEAKPGKKIITPGSAWYKAVKHGKKLEPDDLANIIFLDICAVGSLKASGISKAERTNESNPEFDQSINFIKFYLKNVLPKETKIVLCIGKTNITNKRLKDIYNQLIKPNKERLHIYGLLTSGQPKHINANGASRKSLHLICSEELNKIESQIGM